MGVDNTSTSDSVLVKAFINKNLPFPSQSVPHSLLTNAGEEEGKTEWEGIEVISDDPFLLKKNCTETKAETVHNPRLKWGET